MAESFNVDKANRRLKDEMLFSYALDEYIQNRTNTRSSTTILKYESMKPRFEMINHIPVCDIDNSTLMALINDLSKDFSQKYVNDIKNLAISVIKEKIPGAVFRINTGIVEEQDDEEKLSNMPTEVQLASLLKNSTSPELTVAIYLGAFCMMREGEVAALSKEDIDGNIITIRKNMKRDLNKQWCIACTKTKKIRKVIAPQFVVDAFMDLPDESLNMTPKAIAGRFNRLCHRLGYDQLSFHGLRKFGASQWSMENINTAYIQEAGGWSSDNVMKRVYIKTFSDAQKTAFETMNEKYNRIVNL